jgi:AcrR family transcriptional regulator
MRPRGRPRDPAADRAILAATLAVVAEQGYTNLALTEVAKRAGVSTATLYRRWPSKAPLVLDALRTLILTIALPDTGDTQQDLTVFLTERIQTLGSPLLAQLIPALTAEAQRDRAFAEMFRSLQAPVRQQAFALFDRGIARGDLPVTLDRDLALDLLLGPIIFRQFVGGAPLDPQLAPAIIEAVLYGVGLHRK